MILKALEDGYPIDQAVFYDHGYHREEVYKVIEKLDRDIPKKLVTLYPRGLDGDQKTLEYFLTEARLRKKSGELKTGYGWPTPKNAWCCRMGNKTIKGYLRSLGGEVVSYIGVCYLEKAKKPVDTKLIKTRYPLKWMRITRRLAVNFCRERGYDWDGLYERVPRCRCWCCPLERISELRRTWALYPEVWRRLERLDEKTPGRFRLDVESVRDLSARFAAEARGHTGTAGARWVRR